MVKNGKRKRSVVDTQLAVDILSEELKAGQLRAKPQNLEDESLFVEDTQPDNAHIHLPVHNKKRARATKQKRMTKAESIITASKPLPLAPGSTRHKRSTPRVPTKKSAVRFIPTEKEYEDWVVRNDAWSAVDTTSDWVRGNAAATRPTSTDIKHRPQIPAVEVDPAGCSYNPDHELHQDVVAQAVAAEYARQIDKELQPKAPPLAVTEEEFALKEMEIGLFDDSFERGDDDNDDDEWKTVFHAIGTSKHGQQKKTAKERVRRQRHKEMEKEHISKRQLKQSRRDLDSLHSLNISMDQLEQIQAARRARRQADVQERQAREPPKLGRLRFTPQPTQVLASEDVQGSLRTLRTVPVIAKDRFKSLQKRGLIHVTVKQHWAKPTKRRVKRFEKKATQERHAKSHDEIKQLKKQRQLVERSSR